MLIYQLDELAIFLVAVVTLKAGKLEEKQGRILQLAGGMLMLMLAVVMLINPAWMNQISSSLLIFAIAFAATGPLYYWSTVRCCRGGAFGSVRSLRLQPANRAASGNGNRRIANWLDFSAVILHADHQRFHTLSTWGQTGASYYCGAGCARKAAIRSRCPCIAI